MKTVESKLGLTSACLGVPLDIGQFLDLVFEVRVQRNVASECDKGQECREERYQGRYEGQGDVLGEREEQGDEGHSSG